MDDIAVKAAAGALAAAAAVGLAHRLQLALGREIAVATLRAFVQLALVGAAIAAVFRVPGLAAAFVAVMLLAAGTTAGRRLERIPGAVWRATAAVAVPALSATSCLLAAGAFDATSRAAVPTAGILIGGAMVAVTLSGRRLIEALDHDRAEIEARLCLGDDARSALGPATRRALRTGVIPAIDQTRSVGLVTLPGTFVGLVLGGASAEQAAATQLAVLLTLLLVELSAAALLAELTLRAVVQPGERVDLHAPR